MRNDKIVFLADSDSRNGNICFMIAGVPHLYDRASLPVPGMWPGRYVFSSFLTEGSRSPPTRPEALSL